MSTMDTLSESVIVRKMASCASEIVCMDMKLVQSTASLQVGVVKPPWCIDSVIFYILLINLKTHHVLNQLE